MVRLLAAKGIAREHLVAAGYGEFQPIEEGDTDEALAKNRRIELKLTERYAACTRARCGKTLILLFIMVVLR